MLPTNTNVSVRLYGRLHSAADAVAVFVPENAKPGSSEPRLLSEADRSAIAGLLSGGIAKGRAKEIVTTWVDQPGGKTRLVMVAGLGPAGKVSGNSLRDAAALVAKTAARHRRGDVAVVVPTDLPIDAAAAAGAVTEGILLGSFRFTEHKGTASKKEPDEASARLSVSLAAPANKSIREAVERARVVADAQNFARTIASRPGNQINPVSLAQLAQRMARELGLRCRVLDDKMIRRLGMSGLMAVGQASATPPRLIVLEYKPDGRKTQNAKRKNALVIGKSITFDTGGISIKPAEKMGRMIYDKCGGMVVLGLMYAVAKLKLPLHVVGVLSAAENTLGGTAFRPGDILRMYNGVTVEVTNTDAEGRLVLADALAWGIETYKPAAVLDLATLTGGVTVALGKTIAGLMSNNDGLVRELESAGQAAGEKLWRLPLHEEHRELIKSDHADIINSAGREAHPLQGGAFLSFFIPQDNSLPWAHLDIAGVSDTEKELPTSPKGPTGWGVRTLVEWATRRAWSI